MKNFIRKFLGLTSTEEIDALKKEISDAKQELFLMQSHYEAAIAGMFRVREDMALLRQDMRNLYSENTQEISRLNREVKSVKPVLKVEDPKAVKFIKGILSKHERHLNTQQSFLESKLLELGRAEAKANNAVNIATEASTKINNVIKGLGLSQGQPDEEVFDALKYIIKEAAEAGPLQVE